MRVAFVRLFYGRALAGRPSGLPGAYVTGLLTLLCARPPRRLGGRRFIRIKGITVNQLSSSTEEATAVLDAEHKVTRVRAADALITLPNRILAFEMPDDSMHPRIKMGEFALLENCGDIADELGEEVLAQLDDGKWHLRTVQGYSARTVTLSAWHPSSQLKVRWCDIAAIYRVDMIVPPSTFAFMTDRPVYWAVRDAKGNEYGTFPTHDGATDFGQAVADRLGLDEVRYCRVVGPANVVGAGLMFDGAQQSVVAEVCHE